MQPESSRDTQGQSKVETRLHEARHEQKKLKKAASSVHRRHNHMYVCQRDSKPCVEWAFPTQIHSKSKKGCRGGLLVFVSLKTTIVNRRQIAFHKNNQIFVHMSGKTRLSSISTIVSLAAYRKQYY